MIVLLRIIGIYLVYTYVVGFMIWLTGSKRWGLRDVLSSPITVPWLILKNRIWFL